MPESQITRLRAEAAILFAEGEFEAAHDKAGEAIIAALAHWIDRGSALAASEWLHELQLAAIRGMNAANPGEVLRAALLRTARLIMRGEVFVPQSSM